MTFPDDLHKAHPNLVPITSTERARELGSKGGQVRSPRKSLAAKLREMERSKKITPEVKEWLWDMMSDDEAASYHILHYIAGTLPKATTVKDRKELAKLLLDWKKQRHGTKETKHELDITTREFKFIIEATTTNDNASNQVEADTEATVSVELPARPKDD